MQYIPYEKMSILWSKSTQGKDESFRLTLPWVSMEYDVIEEDRNWINEATNNLHANPTHKNVQRFIHELKDYPVFYYKPRNLTEFENLDLQVCSKITIDSSTPTNLVNTFGCPIDSSLMLGIPTQWGWDQEEILNKSRIPGTDLYDPVSLISYLICYRLDWDNHTWAGTDTFGTFLETTLKKDETEFFKIIGWITKQSWYVTTEAYEAMKPALTHFPKNGGWIEHFMTDEIGHYKFMEQVFADLDLNKDDFPVGNATKWLLDCHKRTAELSPLAFSAMINIFEAAYYEGEDPISRVIKLSSRPHAARGFDLHYKINQEHRHCDMPTNLASCLNPQSRDHVLLTLGLFELTLHFLDTMEENLVIR
jgi:hypothetical protein